MAVIKGVLGRFIRAREGDRIGIVVFGSQSYVLSPMTLDNRAVYTLVENIVSRMAGDGTAIGDAIGLGVKKLRDRPEGSRILILVTDGENTEGSLPPVLAAQLAAREGIRIYTIGVGSKGLVPYMEDGQLTQVKMEIDEELLTRVASIGKNPCGSAYSVDPAATVSLAAGAGITAAVAAGSVPGRHSACLVGGALAWVSCWQGFISVSRAGYGRGCCVCR